MLMSPSDRTRLDAELSRRLTGPVTVDVAVDDSSPSRQAVEILEELSSLSRRLTCRVKEASPEAFAPSIALSGAAKGSVRFTGLPTGYEFPTLIDAIIAVSTGAADLSDSARERVERLGKALHLRVFTTPT